MSNFWLALRRFLPRWMTGEVDIPLTDEQKSKALTEAAMWSEVETVRRLREGGTPISLLDAVLLDEIETARSLLNEGADVNMERDPMGERMTPIWAAAVIGNIDMLTLLVDRGADVDYQDWLGQTALMVAAENADIKVVRFLLEKGANIRLLDRQGSTALDFAAECPDVPEVLQVLREASIRS